MPNTPEHTDPHGECAAEIARLREALRKCSARFWEYADGHHKKAVTDNDATALLKFNRNRDMAELCDSALAHPALEGKT